MPAVHQMATSEAGAAATTTMLPDAASARDAESQQKQMCTSVLLKASLTSEGRAVIWDQHFRPSTSGVSFSFRGGKESYSNSPDDWLRVCKICRNLTADLDPENFSSRENSTRAATLWEMCREELVALGKGESWLLGRGSESPTFEGCRAAAKVLLTWVTNLMVRFPKMQVSTAPDEWLSWPWALQHQIILDFLGQKNGKFKIDTTPSSEEELRFPIDIDGAPSLFCAGIMDCGVYEPNAFFAFMILLHDSINEWWHAAAAAMRVRRKERGDLHTRLDADSVQRLPLCSEVTRIRGHLRHVTEAVLCEQRRRVNEGFGEGCENVMDFFVRNPEQLLALLMAPRRDHDQRIASGRADGTMGLATEGAEETSCHDITKVFPVPSAGVKNHVQRFLWQLATQEGMPEKLLLQVDHGQNAEINASFSSFAEDLYGRLWPDRLREWADQVKTGQPLANGLEVEYEVENAEAVLLDHVVVTSDEMLKPISSPRTEDTTNRHHQHPVGNFVCLEMLDFFCATVTRTTGRVPDVDEQDDRASSARTSHEQLLLKVTNATRETFFTAVLDLLRALLELRDRDLHAEIHQRVVSSTEEPTEDTSSNPLVMSRAEAERSLNDVVRKKGRKHYDDFLKYATKLRVTQLLRVAAMLVLEPDHGVGEDNAEDRSCTKNPPPAAPDQSCRDEGGEPILLTTELSEAVRSELTAPRAEMPGVEDRLFTSRWRGRRNLAAEDISLLLNFCYSDQQLPGLKEVAVFAVRNMAHRNAENQKRIDELVRATK